jgi:hypothetical protein
MERKVVEGQSTARGRPMGGVRSPRLPPLKMPTLYESDLTTPHRPFLPRRADCFISTVQRRREALGLSPAVTVVRGVASGWPIRFCCPSIRPSLWPPMSRHPFPPPRATLPFLTPPRTRRARAIPPRGLRSGVVLATPPPLLARVPRTISHHDPRSATRALRAIPSATNVNWPQTRAFLCGSSWSTLSRQASSTSRSTLWCIPTGSCVGRWRAWGGHQPQFLPPRQQLPPMATEAAARVVAAVVTRCHHLDHSW